jgi:SAM-dependent methyltransferase
VLAFKNKFMPFSLSQCRLCGNRELVSILELGYQALTGVFPRTREDRITRGPLELVKCHGALTCGLVQLKHSYEAREMYGENYGYRSSQNQTMIDHLREKANNLRDRFPIQSGDLVLDIGSNDGTLLSFFPDSVTRVGMDPTAAKFRDAYETGIEVVANFFSADVFRQQFPNRKAKIVTSIAMFYDLEDPVAFVKEIVSILDDEGIWHFEQSYLPAMLAVNAYDTICHEHLEYGGSFEVTVAKDGSSYRANSAAVAAILDAETKSGLDTLEPFAAFKARTFEHRSKLLELLADLRSRGARVLGYGASTKGNVILQFCGIRSDLLSAIAEVNPDKIGSFTPGTLISIVSEADAHDLQPAYLLVLPWHFRENILRREANFLARGGKMIFPLPQIEIVGK